MSSLLPTMLSLLVSAICFPFELVYFVLMLFDGINCHQQMCECGLVWKKPLPFLKAILFSKAFQAGLEQD